jgi:hypothetical protein
VVIINPNGEIAVATANKPNAKVSPSDALQRCAKFAAVTAKTVVVNNKALIENRSDLIGSSARLMFKVLSLTDFSG